MSFLGNGVSLNINFNFFMCVDLFIMVIIFLNSELGENGWLLMLSFLVLILEKFSMLFMMVSRLLVVVLIICICFILLVGSGRLVNFLLKFRIVLSGVWIL